MLVYNFFCAIKALFSTVEFNGNLSYKKINDEATVPEVLYTGCF